MEGAVLLRDHDQAVVEVEEEDDRGDEEGQRRGDEHQEHRPRQPRDHGHRADQGVDHGGAVEVVLRVPAFVLPVDSRRARGAAEEVAGAGPHDARPAVEVVEGGREGGREGAEHEQAHHSRAHRVREDARDLAHHRLALHRAGVEPHRREQHEHGGHHERHHMPQAEVPETDLEPAPAVLPRVRGEAVGVDGQIAQARREGVEGARDPQLLHAVADFAHSRLLGLSPLGRLQRHVHAGGEQAEEGGDDQPGAVGDLDQEEGAHLGKGRGLVEVDRERGHHHDGREDLGRVLHGLVASHEQDAHRHHPQPHRRPGEGDGPAEHLGGHVVDDRGRRDQPARLPDRALDQRGHQHVPERPLSARRGVGLDQALAGRVGEAEGHLEAVVLEDVGHRKAPEQRVREPPPRCRGGDQMAGADPGHHQDDPRSEVPEQSARRAVRKLELIEFGGFRRGAARVLGHGVSPLHGGGRPPGIMGSAGTNRKIGDAGRLSGAPPNWLASAPGESDYRCRAPQTSTVCQVP